MLILPPEKEYKSGSKSPENRQNLGYARGLVKSACPWIYYSKKLRKRIESPRHVGVLSQRAAEERKARLIIGSYGSYDQGNQVRFYLFVDEQDGIIVEAQFQAFGQSALIGAADIACECLIGKNHQQALGITADVLDRYLRDQDKIPAFPIEGGLHLEWVIGAIQAALEQCLDIRFIEVFTPTPLKLIDSNMQRAYPGWDQLGRAQKIQVIEEVIDKQIRPYIELDAGGIEIIDLINDQELVIGYKGSCTSCISATGSTLNAIQQILRTQINPYIVVTPDPSFLSQK